MTDGATKRYGTVYEMPKYPGVRFVLLEKADAAVKAAEERGARTEIRLRRREAAADMRERAAKLIAEFFDGKREASAEEFIEQVEQRIRSLPLPGEGE